MILVTGGTGLIGSHLLFDLVKRGERVRSLFRKESNLAEVKKVFSYYCNNAEELFSSIEWKEGDLLDLLSLEEALEGVTHVYHCAGMVSMNSDRHREMFLHNVTGTANMVNTSLTCEVKKFCHVSSVAALGTTTNGSLITEETTWNNHRNSSSYSLSKYLAEREVWRASEEGLKTVVVNPSIVIGPGNWHRSSANIFMIATRGIKWYTTGGIAFVDVRDVVKSMLLLMEKDICNERFIVSSENLLFKTFIRMVNTSVGKPAPNKNAGKLMLELIWRADKIKSIITGSPHIFTKDVAHYAVETLFYSNEKIKRKISIDFLPVSQSVKDTAQQFLKDFPDFKKSSPS
jgi:nucleoside-diphosphate-sugar epimerase